MFVVTFVIVVGRSVVVVEVVADADVDADAC